MFLAVCVSNCIGIALLILLLSLNSSYFRKEKRAKYLLIMVYTAMASGTADVIAYAIDGKPGTLITVLLYALNTWICLAGPLITYFWFRLECDFLGIRMSDFLKNVMAVVNILSVGALLVNFFYPIVFRLDGNVYKREICFWGILAISLFNIICGIAVHNSTIKSGRSLVTFPISVFVVPTLIGAAVQVAFVGISVVWVGVAFGIAGVATAMKSSLTYIDSLTNVYNRYYLDSYADSLGGKEKVILTGIMADINDFKKINDTLGHDVGDEALIKTAEILMNAVSGKGKVIRLGGDEFVILINSVEKKYILSVIDSINKGCEEASRLNRYGGNLSVSMGCQTFDSSEQNFHDFFKAIDNLMYEKKQEYHRLNDNDETLNVRLGAMTLSPDILQKADIGLWAFEIDEGQPPRMYVDETMLGLIGLNKHISPEETYHAWHDHVDADALDLINETVEIMTSGEHAEVQYPWHHPDGHTLIVRCGGVRNYGYQKGVRIEGTHQDVTETLRFDEEERKRQKARELELTHAEFRASALGYLNEHSGDLKSYLNYFAARLRELIKCDQVIYRNSEGDLYVNNSPELGENYQIPTDICQNCNFYDFHSSVYVNETVEMANHKDGFNGVKTNEKCPVKSSLARIVYLDGKPNGYLTIHYILDYHQVTDYERQTLEEFTNLLSLSLSKYVAAEQKHELEHYLANQQRQMKAFGNMVNAALWNFKVNENNEVTEAEFSDEFRHMLGYDLSELPNTVDAWLDKIHTVDKERVLKHLKEGLASLNYDESVYDTEYRMIRKDGQIRWYRAVGRMGQDTDNTRNMYGIFYDITANKELENKQIQLGDALEKAEAANKAKTAFVFNMSHDMRTPINAMLGYTAMAKNHVDDKERLVDCLNKANHSGQLLLSLINGVLDVGRIESGKTDIQNNPGDVLLCFITVENTLRPLAAANDVELSFEFKNIRNRFVYCDFSRCNRVFLNIITNAIKYNRAGGYVRVTCEQIGEINNGYGKYVYTFKDNGIGMSEDFQKHVFEQFSRENNSTVSGIQGSGLGLSVCKSLVELLGGTIEFQSEYGSGTEFTVTLPFRIQEGERYTDPYTGEEQMVSGSNSDKHIDLAGKKVLLVEDNELNLEIAEDMLNDLGLCVETATDGTIAVNMLKEKGAKYYDFILMDIQMPVMNGYEATKAIREMYPDADIPIIAVSANAFEEDKKKSLAAGMNGHVAKPIDEKNLLKTINKVLMI